MFFFFISSIICDFFTQIQLNLYCHKARHTRLIVEFLNDIAQNINFSAVLSAYPDGEKAWSVCV